MRFKWFVRSYVILLFMATIISAVATVTIDATTIPEETEQMEVSMEVIMNEEKFENELVVMNTEPEPELLAIPARNKFEYVEKYPEVPHYLQTDYPHTPYGNYGTIASHGCGIASLSMVLTYLLDKEILPDYLASEYGHYNTESGSSYTLFPDSAEDYGITIARTSTWSEVITALKNGQVIIALAHSNSVFTDSGHFIVLCGITEDAKILVKDPNGWNYKKNSHILNDGFANGFEQKYIKSGCYPFWIYEPKDLENIATKVSKEIKYKPIALDVNLQTV